MIGYRLVLEFDTGCIVVFSVELKDFCFCDWVFIIAYSSKKMRVSDWVELSLQAKGGVHSGAPPWMLVLSVGCLEEPTEDEGWGPMR